MTFSNTVFTNNNVVHSGYMGSASMTSFIRWRFENNRQCLTNADKIVKDSEFDSNNCALCNVERMVVHRCLFKNHAQYAVSGRGPEVTDSVFIDNKIGYMNTGDGGFIFRRNVVTGGEIGVIAAHPHPTIRDNNICGNSMYNFELRREFDLDVGCNWFGVGNAVAARSRIKDGWSVNGLGTARLETAALAPHNIGDLVPEPHVTHPCISTPCDASADCNDHGMCSADGLCVCLPSWSGQHCDVCDYGLIPSPLGEVCAESCHQFRSCTTCLSSSNCGWCLEPQEGRFVILHLLINKCFS